jgi:hypothetical protein
LRTSNLTTIIRGFAITSERDPMAVRDPMTVRDRLGIARNRVLTALRAPSPPLSSVRIAIGSAIAVLTALMVFLALPYYLSPIVVIVFPPTLGYGMSECAKADPRQLASCGCFVGHTYCCMPASR